VALWGFVDQADRAIFKKHRDASFTQSVQLLVSGAKTLPAQGATPSCH